MSAERYNVYAINAFNGAKRSLGTATATHNGNGLFDLYADEINPEEEDVAIELIKE